MAVGEDQAVGRHNEARTNATWRLAFEHTDMDNGGAFRFDGTDDGAGIGILQLGFEAGILGRGRSRCRQAWGNSSAFIWGGVKSLPGALCYQDRVGARNSSRKFPSLLPHFKVGVHFPASRINRGAAFPIYGQPNSPREIPAAAMPANAREASSYCSIATSVIFPAIRNS